jgi:dihydroorotate dehydrogenase (NAD+) catalytic subunit
MSIDVRTRRPKLAGTIGGLSGPAIHPIAVRAVHEVHRAFPHVPLIGQGGVTDADSALQLIMAGASAIAVGTANFVNPRTSLELINDLNDFGKDLGIASIAELVGVVKLEG